LKDSLAAKNTRWLVYSLASLSLQIVILASQFYNMFTPQQTVIPFNKKKLVKFLILSFVFVAIGIWMLLSNHNSSNGLLSNPVVRRAVAVLGILFFGAAAIIFIRRLASKKPAVIINDNGFIENASMFNWGLVSWGDITGFRKLQVGRTWFIIVMLVNPVDFINRQTGIKRKLVTINGRQYGSPVSIAANGLSITIDELLLTLEEKFRQYRQL